MSLLLPLAPSVASYVQPLSPVTISGVTVASNGGTTIPTHNVGNIIVLFVQDTGTTAPTPPTPGGTVPAWNLIQSTTGTSMGSGLWYYVATTTTTTTGSFANSNYIAAVVLFGQGGTPIGGHSISEDASASRPTATAPAVTMSQTDGTSALLHFFQLGQSVAWPAPPSGYNQWWGGSSSYICCDTKNSTTSDGAVTQAFGNGSTNYSSMCATLEIRAH